MAVNVSTVDNTERAYEAARAVGPDGVRPGSLAAGGLAAEDAFGFDLEPDRRSAFERTRAVDGVDLAARMGNRSRRLAMITALSPSVSRQDRPRLAVGAATAPGADTDTSITTDSAVRGSTDDRTTARGAAHGTPTLAVTGSDTEAETATGDGAGTTATRRPIHSFAH